MKDLIKVQQKLIPDLIDKMYRRFYILSTISQNQPVGRRSLSEHMDMTESFTVGNRYVKEARINSCQTYGNGNY